MGASDKVQGWVEPIAFYPVETSEVGELNAPLFWLPIPHGISQIIKNALAHYDDPRFWVGPEADVERVLNIIRRLIAERWHCSGAQQLTIWKIEDGDLYYEIVENECGQPPQFEIRGQNLYQGYLGEAPFMWQNLGRVVGRTYTPRLQLQYDPFTGALQYLDFFFDDGEGDIIHTRVDAPVGAEGPQGPAGEAGEAGAQGAQGPAGTFKLPFTVQYGNGEIHVRWIDAYGNPPYDPDDPTTYIDSAHNIRGPQGEPGEGSGAGSYWVPHTFAYPNGEIKLRWSDGDGEPAYDPDDPTTYLETEHNIRGPKGDTGLPGTPGESAEIPVPSAYDAYCYISGVITEDYALWIYNNYFVIDFVFDVVMQLVDEIPFLSTYGAIPEMINELTDSVVEAMQNSSTKDIVKEFIYCIIIRNEGMSNTEINSWYNEHSNFPDLVLELGLPAAIMVYWVLWDASSYPELFREAVRRLGARAAFFDDRECRDYPCSPDEVAWGYNFNFTEQKWGWVAVKTYSGVYDSEGWHEGWGQSGLNLPIGNQTHVDIKAVFANAGRCDRMGVTFELEPGGSIPRYVILFVGTSSVKTTDISSYGPGTYTIEWSQSTPIAASQFRCFISCSAGNTPGGHVTIKQIHMAGPDTRPE